MSTRRPAVPARSRRRTLPRPRPCPALGGRLRSRWSRYGSHWPSCSKCLVDELDWASASALPRDPIAISAPSQGEDVPDGPLVTTVGVATQPLERLAKQSIGEMPGHPLDRVACVGFRDPASAARGPRARPRARDPPAGPGPRLPPARHVPSARRRIPPSTGRRARRAELLSRPAPTRPTSVRASASAVMSRAAEDLGELGGDGCRHGEIHDDGRAPGERVDRRGSDRPRSGERHDDAGETADPGLGIEGLDPGAGRRGQRAGSRRRICSRPRRTPRRRSPLAPRVVPSCRRRRPGCHDPGSGPTWRSIDAMATSASERAGP